MYFFATKSGSKEKLEFNSLCLRVFVAILSLYPFEPQIFYGLFLINRIIALLPSVLAR